MSSRVKKAITGVGLLLVAFLLLLFLHRQFNIGIPCIFYHVTGLYCPGCGTMRALSSISQWQVGQAFHYNAYLFILVPFLLAEGIRCLVAYLRGKPVKLAGRYGRIHNVVFSVLLAGFVLFGIARNLPMFDFLAPI